MAITDWPIAERPREKLLHQGVASLSDAELLAIFLRTGVKGCTAVDLARQLLAQFGSLRRLLAADKQQFCAAHGLGEAKFVQLQAVVEMARRHLAETLPEPMQVDTTAVAKQIALSRLRDKPYETFAVMLLGSCHQLLQFKELFYGTVDETAIYPRIVVEAALAEGASAVILCHNHPSGLTAPSEADIRVTRTIKKALQLFDIMLLDHLVVGRNHVESMISSKTI